MSSSIVIHLFYLLDAQIVLYSSRILTNIGFIDFNHSTTCLRSRQNLVYQKSNNIYKGYCFPMHIMRKQYIGIAIPLELAKTIDKIISESKLGYTSRAQYIMESIRQKINSENQSLKCP